MDTLPGFVALCQIRHIGGVTLRALLDHFGSLEAILAADNHPLKMVPGIGPQTANAIQAIDIAQTTRQIAQWQRDGITLLTWDHPNYPAQLRSLRDAPPLLFCKGSLLPQDSQAISIVGTRKPTRAMQQWAFTAGQALAARGWTIVSGLAWGIDLAAHQGALHSESRTIAVLGSGVDHPMPDAKARAAERIQAQGALLAEVAPSIPPSAPALVARNRVITGLSQAVIIVESGANSGSLHAAQRARQQGRLVYAVNNGSAGNNSLLADGAAVLPVEDANWDQFSDHLAGFSEQNQERR